MIRDIVEQTQIVIELCSIDLPAFNDGGSGEFTVGEEVFIPGPIVMDFDRSGVIFHAGIGVHTFEAWKQFAAVNVSVKNAMGLDDRFAEHFVIFSKFPLEVEAFREELVVGQPSHVGGTEGLPADINGSQVLAVGEEIQDAGRIAGDDELIGVDEREPAVALYLTCRQSFVCFQ
jgi:hypothetical protein